MDIKKYEVIITPTAYREMNEIYAYITEDLYAEKTAKNLMEKIEIETQRLKETPEIYAKIERFDELKRQYRRIVVKNYVILYTIDKDKEVVYIAHIYYGGRNYLE